MQEEPCQRAHRCASQRHDASWPVAGMFWIDAVAGRALAAMD
jgi:hypothetical protein